MPLIRRRKHRAPGHHQEHASAGLRALGAVATLVTAVLIVAGNVLIPGGAALTAHDTGHRWKHPQRGSSSPEPTLQRPMPTIKKKPAASSSTPPGTRSASPSSPSNPGSPDNPDPSSPTPTSTGSTPTDLGGFGTGVYMGPYSAGTAKSTFGYSQQYSTMYLPAASVTTPNIAKLESEMDGGTSPILDLEFKTGPFTMAQIAAWGPDVQSYFKTFVAGLNTLTDYASKLHNGTRVLFSFNHEAVVKINQKKYKFGGGQPTIADSAAAWNQAMAYVAKNAPDAVRLYWYGGTGQNEDTYADALTPGLIQAASFDPYRWSHDRSSDTAKSLWGSIVSNLKSASWMKNPDGSLKPWGLTEWGTDASFGDASNATFVAGALSFLQDQGATFAVYFDRSSGPNNFIFTDGSQPKTVAAYKAAAH